MTDLPPRLFLPTARQGNWLLIVGFVARRRGALSALSRDRICARVARLPGRPPVLGCARRSGWSIVLYNHSVFGWVALAAALLNLMRPSIVLMSVALAAAGFGLVLHNADLSGLAVALLILSLARPAPAAE